MSLDAMLIVNASHHWRSATFRYMPKGITEPTVWIDTGDKLAMYHPALNLDQLRSLSRQWDQASFNATVQSLLPQACDIVLRHLAKLGVPRGYYADYPRVAAYTLTLPATDTAASNST